MASSLPSPPSPTVSPPTSALPNPPSPTVSPRTLTYSQLIAATPLPSQGFDVNTFANLIVDTVAGETASSPLIRSLTLLSPDRAGEFPPDAYETAEALAELNNQKLEELGALDDQLRLTSEFNLQGLINSLPPIPTRLFHPTYPAFPPTSQPSSSSQPMQLNSEHPVSEHPDSEHHDNEHPTSEHPVDEHPVDEHHVDEHLNQVEGELSPTEPAHTPPFALSPEQSRSPPLSSSSSIPRPYIRTPITTQSTSLFDPNLPLPASPVSNPRSIARTTRSNVDGNALSPSPASQRVLDTRTTFSDPGVILAPMAPLAPGTTSTQTRIGSGRAVLVASMPIRPVVVAGNAGNQQVGRVDQLGQLFVTCNSSVFAVLATIVTMRAEMKRNEDELAAKTALEKEEKEQLRREREQERERIQREKEEEKEAARKEKEEAREEREREREERRTEREEARREREEDRRQREEDRRQREEERLEREQEKQASLAATKEFREEQKRILENLEQLNAESKESRKSFQATTELAQKTSESLEVVIKQNSELFSLLRDFMKTSR